MLGCTLDLPTPLHFAKLHFFVGCSLSSWTTDFQHLRSKSLEVTVCMNAVSTRLKVQAVLTYFELVMMMVPYGTWDTDRLASKLPESLVLRHKWITEFDIH